MFKFLNSKLVVVGLVVLIVSLGWAVLKIYYQKNEVNQRLENLRTRVTEIEKNNSYLEKLSVYFKSNAYLEKEARAKLNYKKADEEVAFIYPDTTKNKDQGQSIKIDNLPNWRKWLYYLFGLDLKGD